MDHHRRPLLASLVALGALAIGAPAAHAATDQTLTFPAGTVRAVEDGALDNTVLFTVTPADPADIAHTRLFLDTRRSNQSHIALTQAKAVYTPDGETSSAACQVYDGRAFLETDAVTVGSTLQFEVRKDSLHPQPNLLLVNDTTNPNACTGGNASIGRQASFVTDGQSFGTHWDWAPPGAPSGLTAVGGPGSITLSWNQPAEPLGLGVRYEVWELAGALEGQVERSVTGTSFTIHGLTPGIGHAYKLKPYRFWPGAEFGPESGVVSAIPTAFPVAKPPAGGAVRGATAGSTSRRRSSSRRLAAPKAARARATRNRVRLTLPRIPRGSKLRISRATGRKGTFRLRSTTSRRVWVDRRVKRGTTYRYRLVRVAANGQRSLASKSVTVRVPRR